MKGPTPKPAHLRQRKNRTATAATLPSEAKSLENDVPPLPERERKAEIWHPNVVEWWESIWRSPMAAEYLASDMKGGLYLLAELYQLRWTETETKALVALASEIRQQEVRFGCSPIDRRRLQWEVEKAEKAEEQTTTRRQRKALVETSKKDPRSVLQVV